jgi:serine/threonine-protein kinase
MGTVWRAHHTELDIRVALKFLAAELAGTRLGEERFRREARAAARLRSAHLTIIHDYGVERGRPYIVMELLEGEDLEQRLQRDGRVPLSTAAALVAQVAKALQVAHDAGVVHRDLKPANLFIADMGSEAVVKILDFGIAKHTRAARATPATSNAVLLGTPFYMSPEQVRGLELDPRSDLWSLAVVAYELVTGTRPFWGKNLGDLMVAICSEQPPAASAICPALGTGLDEFFARSLARPLTERFQTAREFAEAFRRVAADQGAVLDRLELFAPSSHASPLRGRIEETLADANLGLTAARALPRSGKSAITPALLIALGGVLGGIAAWTRGSERPLHSASVAASPSASAANASVTTARVGARAAPVPSTSPPPPPPETQLPSASPRAHERPAVPLRRIRAPAPELAKAPSPREPPARNLDPVFGVPVSSARGAGAP